MEHEHTKRKAEALTRDKTRLVTVMTKTGGCQ